MKMTLAEITAKVQNILAEQLGVEDHQITPHTTREGLGLDSLDQLEVMLAFEEEFGIDFSEEESTRMQTVGETVAALQKRGVRGVWAGAALVR